jgi:hypothetical protein
LEGPLTRRDFDAPHLILLLLAQRSFCTSTG